MRKWLSYSIAHVTYLYTSFNLIYTPYIHAYTYNTYTPAHKGKLMEEMAYVRKKGLEQEHVLSTGIINLQKE